MKPARVHLVQEFAIERKHGRFGKDSVDTAPRTKFSNTVLGITGFDLPSVNSVFDLRRVKNCATIKGKRIPPRPACSSASRFLVQ